jgi:AbrB family looped-hinge helix DNA binding protein
MKDFMSSVSPKGQITLPIEIRRQLGVKPKDKVRITVDGDEVRITLASSQYEASFQAVPTLGERRTLEELTEIAREEQAQEAAREGVSSP